MSKKIACAFVVLYLIIFTGCSLIEAPDQSPIADDESIVEETPRPEPVKGGTLNIPVPEIKSFNPLLIESRDMLNFNSLIFEGVIAYDRNLHPIPALADSWEVSPDNRLWIFKIKRDVKWHNGQRLTAEDVLFTFEALQSGMLNSFYQKDIFENTNIIEAGLKNSDPYTFFIRLAEPSYNVLDMMTFPVLPKSIYQSVDYILSNKNELASYPIGTGPYKVEGGNPAEGEPLKLVRNSSWWNGQPYIDTIVAKSYKSNEEARAAFLNGDIDLVDTMVVYANTYANSEKNSQHKYLTQNYEFLALNNLKPIFSDITIRKAIAYSIDRKEIISKVYLNNAETVDVPIPSSSWLYDSAYRIYDYDPDKARRILQDDGWSDTDGDGILDKLVDDKKVDLNFTIMTNSDNDFRRDAVNLIANHLKRIGFNVIVTYVEWEQLQAEVIANRQFDAILTGYNLDYTNDLRFAFHSGQTGIANNNFISYKSPELDNLIDGATGAYDDNEREKIYQDIQSHLVNNLPVISLYFRTGSLLVDKKVHGIDRIDEMRIYRDIKDWYIAK